MKDGGNMLKEDVAEAMKALVGLLSHHDEDIRLAAAKAILNFYVELINGSKK